MPRPKKENAYSLIDHRHCSVCGKTIAADEKFCGKECEETFNRNSKKRKIVDVAFIVVMLVLLVLILLSPPS